ncbi:MAG TPA: lysylphosphatidylglycerol synthase transmembrane domain-containing protein [Cyclobacteriaceae bacterium]|nr:lysylphosphatidylglycerol synthase transmembrane domain-containing protein [Cyclobacteriaceae bacterium]
MNRKLKSILQYLGMVILAAVLLWLSLRTIPDVEGTSRGQFIWQTWLRANKLDLLIMALVAMLSHLIRAYRWKMLLAPTGHKVSLGNSFLSLMIGYLVNLAVPRGGEISRCYNLLKLEKTPVEISFGTVVAERMIDVLCLLILIAISFFVEWDKLIAFIESLPISTGNADYTKIIIVGLLGLLVVAVAVYFFRKSERLKKIFAGFKDGLLSVFKLDHPWLFIGASIVIWLLYFVTSYFVIVAFPETEVLGMRAVLTLFAIGAIAMAAPLPGGAGSYHTLVPLGLVMLYNMPKGDAVAFVFIFHAWQTFIMIAAGVVSLAISYWIIRWKR